MENRAKQHYCDMDYLRVFAMVCVVYMHAAAGSLRMYLLSANWTALSVLTSLAFCAVPVFFMLSGALILHSAKTADFGYVLKKRIPKLLLPLVVYSVIAAAWLAFQSPEGFTLLGWLRRLRSGLQEPIMPHFWFMYTLLAMYLISPLLYRSLRLLSEKGKGVLAVLLWALICLGTYLRTAQTGAYNATFQSQNHGFEIALAACVFLFCRQNLNRPFGRLNRLIRPMASLSFPVYLLHNIVISVLYFMGLPHERAAHVILATVLVIAVSYLTVKTLATVRPLCFVCTGLRYDEACQSCNWIYTVRTLRRKKSEV